MDNILRGSDAQLTDKVEVDLSDDSNNKVDGPEENDFYEEIHQEAVNNDLADLPNQMELVEEAELDKQKSKYSIPTHLMNDEDSSDYVQEDSEEGEREEEDNLNDLPLVEIAEEEAEVTPRYQENQKSNPNEPITAMVESLIVIKEEEEKRQPDIEVFSPLPVVN